jgi:enediyne biosynthesis protein E3
VGDTDTTAFINKVPTLAPVRGLWRFLEKAPQESDLGRRRFRLRAGPAPRILQSAENSYIFGFNATLSREIVKIGEMPVEQQVFGFEGAAAAATMMDLLTLTRGRRLHELLAGPASSHLHAAHLGAGRAHALLKFPPTWGLRRAHPLLRWLALDGYGFQWSMAKADRMVGERAMPELALRTHCAIFDQGLGRLLWYHDCAAPGDVAARIATYPSCRRTDLWSGVGFAAAYTGGAGPDELEELNSHAGADGYRPHLAQGAAFAATAWVNTGALPRHVEVALPLLAGADVEEACGWTDTALTSLGHDPHTHDDFLSWGAQTRRAWARRHR